MNLAAEADPKVLPEPIVAAPFVVEHLRRNETPSGSFTPDAQLVLTRSFRTSGLLAALPDNEARSLLALLAFLTANGRIEATAAQVGDLLHVSEVKALDRVRRLCRLRWRGEPVAYEWTRENGVGAFTVSAHVVGVHIGADADKQDRKRKAEEQPPSPTRPVASREAVLSHSRAAYGRPRAEVERGVAQQLGYLAQTNINADGNSNDFESYSPVVRRLLALGVRPEQAEALVATHSEQEIVDQLDWLPLRGAKNPARFVVAAIEQRYDPPARVRLERAIAAEEAETAEQKSESILPVPDTFTDDLPIGASAALTLPEGNGSSMQIEE